MVGKLTEQEGRVLYDVSSMYPLCMIKEPGMNKSDRQTIQRVALEMYAVAARHGFHNVDGPTITTERAAMFCANLHGEVSELWEATRRGKLSELCDKECGLTCAEEELADIVIRAMDLAVALKIDIGLAMSKKTEYNRSRPFMHGKKA
jgi:NTP pyrophosphatase (non-canonical NTP hydrolase)